jgi:hypothetical protein
MITKIDKDTFEIKTETVETVSLSLLETQLAEIKDFNDKVELAEQAREALPDELKNYVTVLGVLPTEELENKIKLLKDYNG